MIRGFVVAPVVLLVLLAAPAAAAQTNGKPSSEAAPALPKGAVVRQDAVIPNCGTKGKAEWKEELREPTTVRAKDGTLNTTLEVWPSPITVPVLNSKTGDCVYKTFEGRMYRDPETGKLTFPGPTLRVRRADESRPGDSIRVLLDNHLPPFPEDCVWAGAGKRLCDCTVAPEKQPQCCQETIRPTGMNCFHGANTTNLHFHGLHVSPQKPQDWVFLELGPVPTGDLSSHGRGTNEMTGHFQYVVDPLNERQPEGTHWYHPHKHGSTAEQVGNGLAGALIVEGPFDDWLQLQYGGKLVEKVMIIQQVHDLNFSSVERVGRQFGPNSELISGTPVPLINGQLVPRITMSPGEIQRWRLVSATMEASAQMVIDLDTLPPEPDKTRTLQVRQIAMDGVQFSPLNYRCQPLLDPEIRPETCRAGKGPRLKDAKFQLSPGNRADFLVKAPNLPGEEFFIPFEVIGAIENQGDVPGSEKGASKKRVQRELTRKALDALAPGHLQPALMAVYVCKPDVDRGCTDKQSMELPDTLPPLPHSLRPIVPNRAPLNIQFQVLSPGLDVLPRSPLPLPEAQFGVQMRVNNELKFVQFDPRCANFTAPLDPEGGEEWHISQNINRNEGAPPFHVFHIHTNPFQVVGTETRQKDGTYLLRKYPEPIWQDSITLPDNDNADGTGVGGDADTAGARVVIRRRVEDYTGAYVLHCHFLGHEDRGMMLMVQAVCPGFAANDNFFSRTSSIGPECVHTGAGITFIPALPQCPLAPAAEGRDGH